MTDTLTDRERELVEAARVVFDDLDILGTDAGGRLFSALRAYDPPKVKKYTMPSWDEFVVGKMILVGIQDAPYTVRVGDSTMQKGQYNALREALATEE